MSSSISFNNPGCNEINGLLLQDLESSVNSYKNVIERDPNCAYAAIRDKTSKIREITSKLLSVNCNVQTRMHVASLLDRTTFFGGDKSGLISLFLPNISYHVESKIRDASFIDFADQIILEFADGSVKLPRAVLALFGDYFKYLLGTTILDKNKRIIFEDISLEHFIVYRASILGSDLFEIDMSEPNTWSTMSVLAFRFQHKESIDICSERRPVFESAVDAIAFTHEKHLTFLHLDRFDVTNDQLKQIASISWLKSLSTRNRGLNYLSGLTELEELDLTCCHGITSEVLSPFKKLKKLDLSFVQITGVDLSHLGELTQLEELVFDYNEKLTDDDLIHTHPLIKLRRLSLYFCRKITGTGFPHDFPRLEELRLTACPIVNGGLELIKGFKKLQVLDIASCKLFTDLGITYLSELEELRWFTLEGCSQLTRGIVVDLRKFKKLSYLNIQCSLGLTEDEYEGLEKVIGYSR